MINNMVDGVSEEDDAFAKMTEGTPLGMLLEHVHFHGVEERV